MNRLLVLLLLLLHFLVVLVLVVPVVALVRWSFAGCRMMVVKEVVAMMEDQELMKCRAAEKKERMNHAEGKMMMKMKKRSMKTKKKKKKRKREMIWC